MILNSDQSEENYRSFILIRLNIIAHIIVILGEAANKLAFL